MSVLALLTLAGVTACGSESSDPQTQSKAITVVSHDSFSLPEEVLEKFEAETGYQVTIATSGDAGQVTNKVVLTKDAPMGDVLVGIDNTFASRALNEEVFIPHGIEKLPAGAEKFVLSQDKGELLAPFDSANVCLNIDTEWFKAAKIDPPVTLDDLAKPAYKDLTALSGAATSSPGMAFLLTTIAEYGDDWPSYWEKLLDNGAKLTQGWSDAYYVDFTAGGGDGNRPIVLSYDSSPAFTVTDGKSTTAALLETCYQQVEYAGVLKGAENTEGAKAFVQFLLSDEVQVTLPEQMYVYPVSDSVELPADWASHTERPAKAYLVDADQIDENRDEWLRTWSDVISR